MTEWDERVITGEKKVKQWVDSEADSHTLLPDSHTLLLDFSPGTDHYGRLTKAQPRLGQGQCLMEMIGRRTAFLPQIQTTWMNLYLECNQAYIVPLVQWFQTFTLSLEPLLVFPSGGRGDGDDGISEIMWQLLG